VAAADLNKVLPPAEPAALVITAKPVPLNKDNPKQTRVGELIYRGGLELRSANKDFGGISGMRLWDKDTVLAVTDAGSWVCFKLVEEEGQLVGVKGIAIAPILDKHGKTGTKADRDVESVSVWAESNLFQSKGAAITLEKLNEIWAYKGLYCSPEGIRDVPAEFHLPIAHSTDWPSNGGAEAADISLDLNYSESLILAEEMPGAVPDSRHGIYYSIEDHWEGYPADRDYELSFVPPAGFSPTDVNRINSHYFPNAAFVLNRKFSPASGVAASIVYVENVKAGGVLNGREIARFKPPLTVDNMEGIFITEDRGRISIYIISDDNFSGLQRTLLMKFEWVPPEK
jgi:hypothetical protein